MNRLQSLFGWYCAGVAIWLLLPGVACGAAGPKGAAFDSGREVDVLSTNVSAAGAKIQVAQPGSPLDGVTVEIPPDAVTDTVPIRLYYNTGKFTPVSGTPAPVVVGISAGNLKRFQKIVKIQVPYDAKHYAGMAVGGYAIGAGGKVTGLQMLSQDEKAGTATFGTLVPVLFTWVCAKP